MMTPLRTTLALLLFLSLLLAAGCIEPGYQPNHDIVVIKLSPNGSLEWSKIIDKGGNDQADIIIPTSDGGSLISANYDSLIQLSGNGTVLWEKNYRDPLCMVSALTRLQDGSVIVASSGNGEVCKVDKNGNLLWNKSSVNFDSITTSSIHSIIETKDGGFLVVGNYITRLDADGRPIWQQSYATHDGIQGYEETFSVIEMKNRQEFLGLSRKYSELYLTRFDRNGTIITNSSLDKYNEDSLSRLYSTKFGYSMLFFNTTNSTMETMRFDPDGKITQNITLMNATTPWVLSQNPNIMTSDDGYASVIVRYPDSQTNSPAGSRKISLGVKKMDADGIEVWTSTPVTFCKPESTINIQIKNIVQTSDDGYIILGLRDNFWKC